MPSKATPKGERIRFRTKLYIGDSVVALIRDHNIVLWWGGGGGGEEVESGVGIGIGEEQGKGGCIFVRICS